MICIGRLQIIQGFKAIGTKAKKAQQKVQERAAAGVWKYSSKISSQASTDPESLENSSINLLKYKEGTGKRM